MENGAFAPKVLTTQKLSFESPFFKAVQITNHSLVQTDQ